MRDPRELLSLLTEKIINLESVTYGGIPEITEEDMSHAMGFIRDKKAALLIGVRYCGRTEDIRELDYALWLTALDLFPKWRRENSYIRGAELIRRMCQMAINEYMDEHRCPACQGTSPKLKENLKQAFHGDHTFCETCKDSGRVFPTEAFRAEVMKMDARLWENVWAEKFRRIQLILHSWESSAVSDLYDALREPQTC